MVTLSTNYAQFAGYRMFLDGQLVAQLNGSSTPLSLPSNSSNSVGFRVSFPPCMLDFGQVSSFCFSAHIFP